MNSSVTVFAIPVLFALACGPALGASREDVLEAMGQCAKLPDQKARLACYDRLQPQLKQALSAPPATLGHEPTEAEQENWFGFDIGDLFGGGSSAPTTPDQFGKERTAEAQAARQREEIDSISSGVTRVAYNPFGKFTIDLANGQVWRQIEGDSDHAHFSHDPKEDVVTISRGALGSYNLTIGDSEKLYKVSRVK